MKLTEAFRVAYSLLPAAPRRAAWVLVVMMFVNGFVEVSGIAGILPLISMASDPGSIERNEWLARFYHQLDFHDPNRFLLFLGISYMGLFVLVNVVRAITMWLGFRFTFQVSHLLGTRLLRSYLTRSYSWLRQRNSAELSRDVLQEIHALVENVYLPYTEIFTNGLAALMIALTLLILDPVLALGTGLGLFGLFSLVYYVNRHQLERNGRLRDDINSLRFRAVHEGLYALREARLLGRREGFLRRYEGLSKTYNDATVTGELIYELPKYLTEVLALAALLGALLYFALSGKGQAVAWLGVYIMAIWRMVPSLQQLYRNVARIRFFAPSLQRLYVEFEAPLEPVALHAQPLPLGRGLHLEQVSFAYPGRQERALHEIDLELLRGQKVALVGETGSGKTTVADVVAGLIRPSTGEVRIDGQPLQADQVPNWQINVGYVPQEIYVSDDTLAANIALGVPPEQVDREAVEAAGRAAHLEEFVAQLPAGYDSTLGERGASLSGGQRQRVGIARALYHKPELLILDEATSALDEVTQRRVLESLDAAHEGLTVLVIAHRLEVVRACDRIYLLAGGRVQASGSFEELLDRSPEFRALAGRESTERI